MSNGDHQQERNTGQVGVTPRDPDIVKNSDVTPDVDSGCGKSQLAREVAEKAERTLAPVEPQLESTDIIQDLFLDLAIELEQKGSPRLAKEFDKGEKANFSKALLDTLRYDNVLIIIDEFQRIFPKDTATPPAPIQNLIEQLGNSPNPQGRLLLISNRDNKGTPIKL